ncbi:MAG: DUF1501 domain-containing protein [Rhodothermaceae bacterium]|nr:DUF1501 domain-containing protein [Rhodothermaceae bacterium]
MCTHSSKPKRRPRHGYRLEHGKAHSRDHAKWSRRDFLAGLGLSVAGAVTLGGTPVRAFAGSSLMSQLNSIESDRVLVLVQLSGGNDGLNTIIPYENDIYYQRRPNIAIAKQEAQLHPIGQDLGVHPSMEILEPYFGDGDMAILQNVGYPDPDLSHFRSTDIWLSGSDSDSLIQTGWVGRHLNVEYPDFEDNRPSYPLAVQIGGVSSLMLQGPATNMGMSLVSEEFFERLAEDGTLYNLNGLPSTAFGDEMNYVRSVANDSFIYAAAVQEASQQGANAVEYPGGNPLANSLGIVARLIKGQLGAKIYHVTLGGFDTHANQAGVHANLLNNLSQGINAFLQDITEGGMQENVIVMTFSEFGRRVGQNGSFGTDHGTAAPLFLVGKGINGGLMGSAPDLEDLDNTGNMKHEIDFRTVYASILQNWFGIEQPVVEDVLLGHSYTALDIIESPAEPVSIDTPEEIGSFTLQQNYPNPFSESTTLQFTLDKTSKVRLQVFDITGREVQSLMNRTLAAGTHTVEFHGSDLPSGIYITRLITPNGVMSKKMMKVK